MDEVGTPRRCSSLAVKRIITSGPQIIATAFRLVNGALWMSVVTTPTLPCHDGEPRSTVTWISMERNMKCGVGFCGHCQFGPLFVCKDGPVFRYDRVASLLGVREV